MKALDVSFDARNVPSKPHIWILVFIGTFSARKTPANKDAMPTDESPSSVRTLWRTGSSCAKISCNQEVKTEGKLCAYIKGSIAE